jgi:hypothetical protein
MAEYPASVGAKDLLAAHAVISGWTIEIGAMPKTPNQIIVITDTGGLDPNPKWLLDFPRLQIMVRGDVGDYLDTFREAKAVKDLLLGITSLDLNDDRWVSVTGNGDLGFVGRDENMRPLFAMNFALIIEPQSVANSNRLAI